MENYYKQKAIESGNRVEILRYERGVFHQRSGMIGYRKPVGRSQPADPNNKEKNRIAALKKAKKTVVRMIHANYRRWGDENGEIIHPKFVTLSYRRNMKDVKKANKEFKAFIRRLNYHVYKERVGKLKYVAVIEFQDRGAVHYHCVFFNLPFIEGEQLTAIWKHGNAHIDNVKHVGRTATYLTKRMREDDRLAGLKCYLNSKGLHEPVVTTNKEKVDEIVVNSELIYKRDIDSEYYGKIKYEQRTKKRKGKR